MKTFKTEPVHRILLALLTAGVGFLMLSHHLTGGDLGPMLVYGLVLVILIVSQIALSIRTLTVEKETLRLSSMLFKKQVDLTRLQDVSVMNLKGRFVLLITGEEDFMILSSLFQNFGEVVALVRSHTPEDLQHKLAVATDDELKGKRTRFIIALVAGTLLSFGFGVYNLLG